MSDFITSALWNWFLGWPAWAHILLAAGVVLTLWGALNGLMAFASKIGGWQAALGAALGFIALLGALWPRKRTATTTEQQYPDPDKPEFPMATRKKKRKTLRDLFKGAAK